MSDCSAFLLLRHSGLTMFDTAANIAFPSLATPENAIVASGRRGETTKVASHGSHAPGDTQQRLLLCKKPGNWRGRFIDEVKSLYVRIRVRCCMRKFGSHAPDYWKNETSVVQRDQISFVKSCIYLLKCIWFGRGFHAPWSHSHVLAAFFWFARSHHDRRTREQGTWVGKHHPHGPNLALMRIQQNSNSLDLHSALIFLPPGEFSVTPDFEMWRGDACANASAIASLDGSSSHCKCSVTRWQAGRAIWMLCVLFLWSVPRMSQNVWRANCKLHKLDNYDIITQRHQGDT